MSCLAMQLMCTELEPGTVLQNYYGLLADNAAIQLINDSKIYYALQRIKSTQKEL